MQNNILKYVMVFLTVCIANVPAFAQEEITDSVSANLIVEEELSVDHEVDNSAIYKEVAPLSPQITDYKKTKEWKRFCVFTGVGLAGAALTSFLALASYYTISYEGELTAYNGLLAGATVISLAGTITSFIFAHKNKVKAKKSVTNVGVGAITAPMSGNKREVMPALTFSLSF